MAQTKLALKRISDGHVAGTKTSEQVVQSLIHSLDKPQTSMALIDIWRLRKQMIRLSPMR